MDSSCLHTVYVRFLENRFLSVIQQTRSWHLLILWKQQTFFDIFTTCGDDVSTPLNLHDHSLDINVRVYISPLKFPIPPHLCVRQGRSVLQTGHSVLTNHWVQLCLDLPLHLRIPVNVMIVMSWLSCHEVPDHVQHGPGQGGWCGLRPGEEEVHQTVGQILHALDCVIDVG